MRSNPRCTALDAEIQKYDRQDRAENQLGQVLAFRAVVNRVNRAPHAGGSSGFMTPLVASPNPLRESLYKHSVRNCYNILCKSLCGAPTHWTQCCGPQVVSRLLAPTCTISFAAFKVSWAEGFSKSF